MSACNGQTQKRQGLQVVKLSQREGVRYEVDEEALASVLMRPDVRNLPVVVVSVAGAYRGGKSFILDFFLRYLNAPRSSQSTCEWLGREDDVLEGFDWRGGGESNTKGIHLWPEPIIVNNERTGDKVAVLLMDTQGTFDTESDMGDNSTIFAMSTLLSSVQIYNLRANIGEDDLQHLQLFTEYGKLACDGEGKAFQTLNFLVRDWMNPYEHSYGYSGGKALLDKRLKVSPNQKKQLLEVREHIHSCFENIQCFLMPHPGLKIIDERFRGRLCDISEQFRLSLLELVPSLFDPNNLTVKFINGEKVKAQGLLEYFKQYVGVFNSDDIPEAQTILQATAEGYIMSLLREAREMYERCMDDNVRHDQSVTKNIMQELHKAAVNAAIQHFQGKKKIGSQDKVEKYFQDLQKELETKLSLYMWQNEAKLRDTLSQAKRAYESHVDSVCEVQARLCLHENDLAALHRRAKEAALEVFDQARRKVPRDDDEERKNLIMTLEQHYQGLISVNKQNNRTAILEARQIYLSRMREEVTQSGVSTEVLNDKHNKALAAAVKHFHRFRSQRTEEKHDPFEAQLKEDIKTSFEDFEKMNLNSNRNTMQFAEYSYNNYVTSAWGPQSCCFHPKALAELHRNAKAKALEQFLTDREDSAHDEFKDKLIQSLETRYRELQEINNFNNELAIEHALSEYTRLMDKHTAPALTSIFVVPFLIKLVKRMPEYHESAKNSALNMLRERRRGSRYNDDKYVTDLEEKISNAYEDYRNPLLATARELGLQHLLPFLEL